MAFVVGPIVVLVGLLQLLQAGDALVEWRVGRQVEHERAHLGADEVVGARRAEPGETLQVFAGEEFEHDVVVGEVADHRPIGGRHGPYVRSQRGGAGAALVRRERPTIIDDRAERFRPPVLVDVVRRRADHPYRVRLGLVARGAPRGDAVPAEDHADRFGMGVVDRRDVESELEAGASPRHPQHAVTEDLLGELLPIGCGRDRDPAVGVEVIHVVGGDEAVHRGVDRRCRSTLAVAAEVERGDHLVLAFGPGVDARQGTQAVESQDRQAGLGERAEIAARPLDPHQLDGFARDRVDVGGLGRRVAAGVVGVALVGTEAVRAVEQLADVVVHFVGLSRATAMARSSACELV